MAGTASWVAEVKGACTELCAELRRLEGTSWFEICTWRT